MSGDIQLQWDEYQNEQIRIFYGNEPKAKKKLRVLKTKPGSVLLPGLSGKPEIVPLTEARIIDRLPDAHAHLIEYGFKMQLPLDQCRSLSGMVSLITIRLIPDKSRCT